MEYTDLGLGALPHLLDIASFSFDENLVIRFTDYTQLNESASLTVLLR